MKAIIQTINAPCGLFSALPLLAALFATAITPASAQIYVDSVVGGVDKFDVATGAPINTPLVPFSPGITNSLALFGNNLFVAQTPALGPVTEYNATTGAVINPGFGPATGFQDITVSGGSLYVDYGGGTIAQFNATTLAPINPILVSGLAPGQNAIAVSGNTLFCYNGGNIGKFNATTGAPISPNFISGLTAGPSMNGLAISGNNLFVSKPGFGVLEFNATTGAPINSIAIAGSVQGIGIAGNDLFVANGSVVGEYDATTGAAIDANFISGLPGGDSFGLAVVAAPEPSALALMAASGLVFMLWRRRRCAAL